MASRILYCAVAALSLLTVAQAMPRAMAVAVAAPSPTPTGPSVCGQSSITVAGGNGGFENGLQGWLVNTVGYPGAPANITVVHPGHNSNTAIQMSVGYSASIGLKHIPACEATDYVIAWDYQVLTVTHGAPPECSIYATAGTGKYNTFTKSINNPAPGNWTHVAFNYKNDLYTEYAVTIGIDCEDKGESANILFDNVSITPGGSIDPQGCPKNVSVVNGGFESGALTPWKAVGSATTEIIEPGYKSQHALQVNFPAGAEQSGGWYIDQPLSSLCEGLYYNVSFAVNWVNYTGPASNPDNGCSITISPGQCQFENNEGYYYATSSPGWKQHSFTCQSYGSQGPFDIEVDCLSSTTIPAFAVQFDRFALELIGSTAPSASNVARAVADGGRRKISIGPYGGVSDPSMASAVKRGLHRKVSIGPDGETTSSNEARAIADGVHRKVSIGPDGETTGSNEVRAVERGGHRKVSIGPDGETTGSSETRAAKRGVHRKVSIGPDGETMGSNEARAVKRGVHRKVSIPAEVQVEDAVSPDGRRKISLPSYPLSVRRENSITPDTSLSR